MLNSPSIAPEEKTSAQLLNTSYVAFPMQQVAVKKIFERAPKLGNYCIVQAYLNSRELIDIVVDRQVPALTKELMRFFPKSAIQQLSTSQIDQFIHYLQNYRSGRFQLKKHIGLAPHKDVEKGKFLKVFYLEDILDSEKHKHLVYSIVAQILFEQFSNKRTRIVSIEQFGVDSPQKTYAVMVQSADKNSAQIFTYGSERSKIHKKQIENLQFNHQNINYKVMTADVDVRHPKYHYSPKEKVFSIIDGNGQELDFQIVGRSPAEKRFKREKTELEVANMDEMVPIELGFHPYWRRLGHTTLRIGESLFELSSKGWKAHVGGRDSARAYIFNNPYFKEQYRLYKNSGMPPISIGISFYVTKYQALNLLNTANQLAKVEGRKREKFSLLRNNCNHGIMRVMEQSGIPGFQSKGYLGFSSILSFRQLLLYPQVPVIKRYIYPLPGTEIEEEKLRLWIPKLLYRYNNSWQEVCRAVPSLLWDALVIFGKRLSDLIYKVFRVRVGQGSHPYFMG